MSSPHRSWVVAVKVVGTDKDLIHHRTNMTCQRQLTVCFLTWWGVWRQVRTPEGAEEMQSCCLAGPEGAARDKMT